MSEDEVRPAGEAGLARFPMVQAWDKLALVEPVDDLYERDYAEWAAHNADLLRSGRLEEADIPNIAEELEDMGKGRRLALASHLRILLAHLLKHGYQPQLRGPSWMRTILNQRAHIEDLLDENPSLKPLVGELAAKAYPKAVKLASVETGLPVEQFPGTCPWTVDQLLDEAYLP